MTTGEAAVIAADESELADPSASDLYHRLVPESVPRHFAEPTPELTARVARGLRGLVDGGQ
ncbi:hypothetical protein [Streptomyces corynorhini]|uniref:Uncharacterized protein n=1 Tax=Streptomyces corynorhini TaxID=2282652 RepID=A0A370BC14_9ACTN|nr:hypothetical protein [Streptomyces corynorhini]RDG39330.1 hypothetical protein DVH02_04495 [Streptomyces corynorhini]